MSDRAMAPSDCNVVDKAFRGECDRLGLAKALATDAGRAWLKFLAFYSFGRQPVIGALCDGESRGCTASAAAAVSGIWLAPLN